MWKERKSVFDVYVKYFDKVGISRERGNYIKLVNFGNVN